MEPRGRKAASLAAAVAATWWAGTAAADPGSPETGHQPPVVAPPSHDAASDGRSEPAPASPSAPPATAANAVASKAPTNEALPPSPDASTGDRTPHRLLFEPPDPQPRIRWYGYQNILVDVGGLTLAVVALGEFSGELAGLALATYLLGSPSVHWGHGHVGKGFGSLGLRVVAPALGAGIGCGVGGDRGDWGCFGGFFIGGLVGGGVAMAVDYAVLAREQVPTNAAARSRLTPSFALVPDAGRLMPSVSLCGTF